MKIKQPSRILCALSAVALCVACVSAPGLAVSYHGGEHGKVILNGWEYSFTTRVERNLMTGEYQSVCTSDAAVVRVHHNLYGQWLTTTRGIVTAFGGSRTTGQPMYGTSRSNFLVCPVGIPQMVRFTRIDARITMYGDNAVTSTIFLKSDTSSAARY